MGNRPSPDAWSISCKRPGIWGGYKNHIYFFLYYGRVGAAYTVGFILVAAAGLLLISWLLWWGNRALQKKRKI